ncbi:hypothetical protein QJS10_CPB17g01790 [Acorus calamus]|uniref:Uncharacterized protein n=1 Tax=Acorus calamus TaxID=4465 RepID=A0AAV9CY27_ACOCL|nr:hypothetical protein QJS10_CPB17g01790 [Acorus calamus]
MKQASERFYTAARQRVRGVAERVRDMYEMDPRIKMDLDEFADMLFLDACFVVHFISGYQEGYLLGTVHLPRMTVNDSTKSNFLNLIALEMDPEDSTRGYGVISYICLLDNLIDHADDVRELRSRGILINCLGSDQQVADLFNELATDLTPDPNAYRETITGIHDHLKKSFKVSIARANYTYFNTPWSIIATFAATLGLGFSGVQAFK